jgi:dsRNA-specific ribonuclease
MSTKNYNPTTELGAGLKPSGSGDFALIHARHIVVGENNEVLDWKLEQLAKGEVVPRPAEISTEAEMNNILANATEASIGTIYKYTGTTADTYEPGALYVITHEIPDGDEERY